MNIRFYFLFLFVFIATLSLKAQTAHPEEGNVDNLPVHEYHLTINKKNITINGKTKKAMTVNGGIPGPNLKFTEGEFAVIYVTNKMDVETSVHWHGMILPNYYDGVPYLSTPPIRPGKTFKYQFPIHQSGTYWYHSHTGLQEQLGVYGSIQIDPKKPDFTYDKDLVLVLSDWTDENPKTQLKNLKRGNEWYLIKKGQIQSLDKILKEHALGAKLKMRWQRMPDMAVSDNYYNYFLVNGEPVQNYPNLKPGEKVRVRIVNASSASYYWLTFGQKPTLISSDGVDVVPVKKNKTLIAVAETYDYLVTIPKSGKLEIRATAQDGSGHASAYLGKGDTLAAPKVPEPDMIQKMKQMMAMKMKMGAPASKFNPSKPDSIEVMKKYAMDMNRMSMGKMENSKKKKMGNMKMKDTSQKDKMKNMKQNSSTNEMKNMKMKKKPKQSNKMKAMQNMDMGMKRKKPLPADKVVGNPMKTGSNAQFNYDYLRSPVKTNFPKDKPVKELLFNLTGNMNRYVWSINGVPLSETDKIKIKKGEVVRITLNNLTMMHHPMHLHGHFFRVLNKNGDYSPLKHTVDVAPMQKTVIEFAADATGDWFFHCHILYHLSSGMARIFSQHSNGQGRDPRLKDYPLKNLTNEADRFFNWGEVTAASHMADVYYTMTNIRNQFTFTGEYGWNKNLESEFTYQRYLNDYFRVFGGVNVENEYEDNLDKINTTAIAGVRYLLPLLIDSDLRIDNKLRPQISLSTSIMLFPRIGILGEYEYQMDFGWNNDLPTGKNYIHETTWNVDLEYVLSENFRIMAGYDNRFGAGGGLSYLF